MKLFLRAAAAACLIGLAATPALAQSLNPGASGTYGQVRLRTGFQPDPHSVTVQAGGPLDAATAINDSCVGSIAARPDYSVRYRAGDTLPLIFSVTSDVDTTLVVRGPDGSYSCDDDSAGNLDPLVRYDAPRSGRYQVWVGRFGESAEAANAVLNVSEVGAPSTSGAGPDMSQTPAYGEVSLSAGFQPDPHTVAISAGGAYDASQIEGASCTGWIASAPDYRVQYTSGSLPLIFSVAAESDTTLVVNGPNGDWYCDDDGGEAGLNPMIRFDQPGSGQYDIWVGTYAEGALQQSTLHVSELTSQ